MRADALVDAEYLAQLTAQGYNEPVTLWDLALAAPPDRLAVVCPRNGEVTYRTLLAEAIALAGRWKSEGITSGDVVIIHLPNCYEFVLAHLALTRLGAVTLPVPINYRLAELAVIGASSRARGIVCNPTHAASPDLDVYEQLRDDLPSLDHVWQVEDGQLRISASEATDESLGALPDPDDVTLIMSTSGTTGVPKLVLHTHRSTVGGTLQAAAREMGLDGDDVLFAPSPLAHMSGFQYGTRLAITLGTTLLLLDKWDPVKASRLIEQYRGTWSLGATPFLYDFSQLPDADRGRLATLRVFVCGGAPIPPSIAEAAREALPHVSLCPVWGMSETCMGTMVRPSDPAEKVVSSDGRALPGYEVRIRKEDGTDAAPGEIGEIQVRGAGLFHGYFERPDLTYEAVPDGWMRTGDLGYCDEDGYMRCQGRVKDLIIRGGVNISSVEVENHVRTHPAIEDVAVVGVTDPRLGERVGAVVVLASGQEVPTVAELDAYLTERGLARHKHPEQIKVVDVLPRTPAGKVQKFLVREEFEPAKSG